MFIPLLAERTLLSDLLLGTGLALLTAWLLLNLRKKRQRHAEPTLTREERVERVRQQRGLRGDLEGLMVEIEQLAKRLGAQLDAKAIQVENLIQRAERRIEELHRVTGVVGEEGDDGDGVDEGVRGGTSGDRAGWTDGGGQADGVGGGGEGIEVGEAVDPLAKEVYALADQGLEPLEIAGQLNEHVGKVELILALREA